MLALLKHVSLVMLLQLAVGHGALAALGPAVPPGCNGVSIPCVGNPGPPDNPRTGTVSPFPLWYKDGNGLTLAACLNNQTNPPGLCVVLGANGQPLPGAQTFPNNFAGENFYWLADSSLTALATPGPNNRVVYRAALETSFFGAAAPTIADGQQITFARIRIRIDAPVTGTYTVTHPFGVYTQNVAAPGIRAIDITQDIGCLPAGAPPCDFTLALHDPPGTCPSPNAPACNMGTPKSIGPFLIWDTGLPVVDTVTGDLYVGNPVMPHTVMGSTFVDTVTGMPANFVRIDGPAGSNIGGAGVNSITNNMFKVSGKLARGPLARDDSAMTDVNTPVTIAVLTNDIQPPPGATIDPATVMVVAAPGHGMAAPHPDGTVTYTPATDFRGPDTFKYTVNDTGNPAAVPPVPTAPATSNIATVSVMIPTTTTTTTTLPCVTPRCILDKALTGSSCLGQNPPGGISNKIQTAEGLIDQAGTSSAKKARKSLKRSRKLLKAAETAAKKAAKKNKLSANCATALESAIETAVGDINTMLGQLGK